ncbi:MAG: MotA/TolQ/ExbB proton channel family protein [Chlamydiae bacterium]|nr:MotA/TolQ/ExbB proton channel family protein [Chlamydiota bacterium]MBI3266677.1 MotA/TolQ/ExbB proton channel family protein [Chlamydiota bacterium]
MTQNHFIEILLSGGWTMIPLLGCSILSLAVILERAFSLRKNNVVPSFLITLVENSKTPEEIERILKAGGRRPSRDLSKNNPTGRLTDLGLSQKNLSKEENEKAVELAGRIEARHLESGFLVLEMIAVVAPLLGLLGTVLGMFDVFAVISTKGIGLAKEFSGGISKALVTTIAGLVIAIPTLIAHTFFTKKVENMVLDMETCIGITLAKIYHE